MSRRRLSLTGHENAHKLFINMKDENITDPIHWAAGYDQGTVGQEGTIRSLAEIERAYIEMVIEYCRGNVPHAAKLLQISPSTIYRKQSRWYRGRH